MIIFLALLMSLTSWAKFDLTYGLQGRTLPSIGAEAYIDSGYNFVVWGKKETQKDIKYGLLRPSLGIGTSGVINSVKGELEFFPISFLGFSAGRQIIHSNYDFPFFDCDQIQCQGEFTRNFVESKIALGYGGWIVVGNYKVDTLRSPSRKIPMADWRNVIVGTPGEEVQIDKKLIIGKAFPNQLVGVLLENVQFTGTKERKESYALIYQLRKNDTSYMIGSGIFHTDREPMGLILYFRIHHQKWPSLKLF